MTNNPDKITNLEEYGIAVAERVPLTPHPNDHNLAYLLTKRDRMGHALPDLDEPDLETRGAPVSGAGAADQSSRSTPATCGSPSSPRAGTPR